MKVNLITDQDLNEDEITIKVKKIDEKILNVVKSLEQNKFDKIILKQSGSSYIMDLSDIERIYSLDKKNYAVVKNNIYICDMTLKELENLDFKPFIRISQSEIININFVKSLNLSFTSTVECTMKNGDVCYVSRRKVKEFKEKVGIIRR